MRELTEAQARGLQPGSDHYTAYVGPPSQYDFMGATQFALLFHLGLRARHKVLDFGCGSLRAGRLLIPYLDPGNYYGIEPNTWLVKEGIERQLGGLETLKQPTFSSSDAFVADVFGEEFDFIVAQSIFSHSGPTMTGLALRSFSKVLRRNGICAVTFVHGEEDPAEGWLYPGVVSYRPPLIVQLAEAAGLIAAPIPWQHPRQTWWLMGHELPTKEFRASLLGCLP